MPMAAAPPSPRQAAAALVAKARRGGGSATKNSSKRDASPRVAAPDDQQRQITAAETRTGRKARTGIDCTDAMVFTFDEASIQSEDRAMSAGGAGHVPSSAATEVWAGRARAVAVLQLRNSTSRPVRVRYALADAPPPPSAMSKSIVGSVATASARNAFHLLPPLQPGDSATSIGSLQDVSSGSSGSGGGDAISAGAAVTLSPGMTAPVRVAFTAVAGKKSYSGAVVVRVTAPAGTFDIPIVADPPQPKLSVSVQTVALGPCAIGNSVTQEITVTNSGPVPARYSWQIPGEHKPPVEAPSSRSATPSATSAAASRAQTAASKAATPGSAAPPLAAQEPRILSMTPISGILAPQASVKTTVTFTPRVAGAIRAAMALKFAEHSFSKHSTSPTRLGTKSVLLADTHDFDDGGVWTHSLAVVVTANAKYPRVMLAVQPPSRVGVSDSTAPALPRPVTDLDLGTFVPGVRSKAVSPVANLIRPSAADVVNEPGGTLVLVNPTLVPATFSISPASTIDIPAVSLKVHGALPAPHLGSPLNTAAVYGILPPGAQCPLSAFVMAPSLASSSELAEPWVLSVLGAPGAPMRILFRAKLASPAVSITPRRLVFGDVEVGSGSSANKRPAVVKQIQVTNQGNAPAKVQLRLPESGKDGETLPVFSVNKSFFELAPGSTTVLSVTFSPPYAGAYWRTLEAAVLGGETAILDVLGTGSSQASRTGALVAKHVQAYCHRRDELGLGSLGPEHIDHLIKLGTVVPDPDSLQLSFADPAEAPAIPRHTPLAVLDSDTVDFGACSRSRAPEPRAVTVCNMSTSRLVGTWNVSSSAFAVEPASIDVAANGGRQTFRMYYRPTRENAADLALAEAYVSSIARPVHPAAVTPPCPLVVQLVGDTLAPQIATAARIQPPLPVTLDILKPLTGKLEKTVELFNSSDCPAHFSIAGLVGQADAQQSQPPNPWRVSPSSSIVEPGRSLLLSAELNAADLASSATWFLPIIVHGSQQGPQDSNKLRLNAHVLNPSIRVGPASAIALAPALIGQAVQRAFQVISETDVPLTISCSTPAHALGDLEITLPQTRLAPRACMSVAAKYTPREAGSHIFHVNLSFSPDSAASAPMLVRRTTVSLAVTGVAGCLAAQSNVATVPHVLVRSPQLLPDRTVVVVNPTACPVMFVARLRLARPAPGGRGDLWDEPDPGTSVREFHRVPARGTTTLPIQVNLPRVGKYRFLVQVSTQGGKEGTWENLSEVHLHGIFPALEIVSVTGNAMTASELYRSNNINDINAALRAGHSDNVIQVAFAPQPVGSIDSSVAWLLRNAGPVELQWCLSMPNDPARDETTGISLHDTKPFRFSSRAGTLAPGATEVLTITCPHKSPGERGQSVQVQVSSGAECCGTVALFMSSVTLAPGQGYLFHPGEALHFGTASIAIMEPVLRSMALVNRGDMDLTYSVDTDALDEFAALHYGFPIFSCPAPTGTLPAGDQVAISLNFHPIQPRDYVLPLRIAMEGGNSFTVTLRGAGVLPTSSSELGNSTAKSQQAPPREEPAVKIPIPDAPVALPPSLHPRLHLDQRAVYFDLVPSRSMSTRVAVLSNTSRTAPAYYVWVAQQGKDEDVVRIVPPAGMIEPGKSELVRVYAMAPSAVGESTHLLDCVYAATMSGLQRSLSERASKPHAGAGGSRPGSMLHPKPLPGISAPAVPVADAFRTGLAIHVRTVASDSHTHAAIVPRYAPTLCDDDESFDWRAEDLDAVSAVLQSALDGVFLEIEREGVVHSIHDHAKWHDPPVDACPQSLMQDVLEGALFGVLRELFHQDTTHASSSSFPTASLPDSAP
uniref:Predicted protein n=1 Tax=Hordeum vulgare subsp. vulgare TaxID=112509 RepID=F2DYE5_HORVV|nr:predicted protein [Hordeum vulgare subsp. vulgare]